MGARESTKASERVHVRVSGRVQGVWFRESTRRRAEELGLSGWVRNLPDGRVEAQFEGAVRELELALSFVAEGPPHARVLEVEIVSRQRIAAAEAAPENGFRVR